MDVLNFQVADMKESQSRYSVCFVMSLLRNREGSQWILEIAHCLNMIRHCQALKFLNINDYVPIC